MSVAGAAVTLNLLFNCKHCEVNLPKVSYSWILLKILIKLQNLHVMPSNTGNDMSGDLLYNYECLKCLKHLQTFKVSK